MKTVMAVLIVLCLSSEAFSARWYHTVRQGGLHRRTTVAVPHTVRPQRLTKSRVISHIGT